MNGHTLKSGIACMFTLSKVRLDVCLYFQKCDWMYTYSKVGLDYAYTFKSGIGCIPKMAFNVC